jgi:hemolysin III
VTQPAAKELSKPASLPTDTSNFAVELEAQVEVVPQSWKEYWTERIPWYPDGCFGPYRCHADGYSRRELVADGITHVLGISLGCVGVVMLIKNSIINHSPRAVTASLSIYSFGLLAMLCCSAAFNGWAWSRHIWKLQLCDHTGILLLIAGSYTPLMIFACCHRVLVFVWSLAFVSFVAKASRSRFDVVALHVPCFLLMGWSCMLVWHDLLVVFTPWAFKMLVVGGVLYTVGLVPWALNKIEFHNAAWHMFVLAASTCMLAILYVEVAQPSHWQDVSPGTCRANAFVL